MELFTDAILVGPPLLAAAAGVVFLKRFGRHAALSFLCAAAAAMAAILYAGFRASEAYLASGGWTASTLAPFLYWIVLSYPAVVACIFAWGVGSWLWRRRRRVPDVVPRDLA